MTMASQEVHENKQRERKRQQTRRERKRTSGRQERLCGLPFSPSGAMVTCRAVAQHRRGSNASPNQDKTISQKVFKVVKNKDIKFTNWVAYVDIKHFRSYNRTKWQKEISVDFDCNEFFRDERGSDIQIIYCRSDAARGYECLLKCSSA